MAGADARAAIFCAFDSPTISLGGNGSKRVTLVNSRNVDLLDMKFLDQMDDRLQVTKVIITCSKGYSVQNGDSQKIKWTVPVLAPGQSVTITIDFSVPGTTSPAQNINNICKLSVGYTDDEG